MSLHWAGDAVFHANLIGHLLDFIAKQKINLAESW
jgi:hypothetical protein